MIPKKIFNIRQFLLLGGDRKLKIKVLNRHDRRRKVSDDFYKVLLIRSIYFILGVISTQGRILGDCTPFGVSLASSVPRRYSVSTIIGIFFGYFCSSEFGRGIGYITSIIIIIAIKWTLSEVIRVKKYKIYIPMVCFVPMLAIGTIVNYPGEFSINYFYMVLTEALIAAVSAYFFDRTFKIIFSGTLLALDISQMRYVLVSLFITILSLSTVTVYKLSVGRIVSIVIILLSAYCMGVYGGSVSGALAGAMFGLSSFGMAYISGVYAFGGMFSGMCSSLGGKIPVGISFLLCGIIYLFSIPVASGTVMISTYEMIFGVIGFLLIPQRIIAVTERLFSRYVKSHRDNRTESNFIEEKNGYISETIKWISDIPESVIPKVSLSSNFELENICMKSVYSICGECKLRMLCWDKDGDSAGRYFGSIISDIIGSQDNKTKQYECSVSKRCKKLEKIIKNIKISKNNFFAGSEAKKRAEEIREGMSEKFSLAEALLGYAYEGISTNNIEDEEIGRKIKKFLSKYGIETVRAECRFTSAERIFIEIEVMKVKNKNLFSRKILSDISLICGRYMDEPIVIDIENRTIIRIPERAMYEIDTYVSRHACNNGKFCGDCCSYFKDGSGKFSVVISDGMGTGGRAATDGAVTSGIIERLIKLRVEPSSAVKIANLSILGKSENESLTAVDVMTIDLFSGEAEFIKAGAPLTFVKRGDKINKIDTSSLPIGIFNETNMSISKMNLNDDDLILMVSDGVTDVGIDWVKYELENLKNYSLKELSERILRMTLEKRISENDDDITVATMRIKRNNL